MYRNRLFIVIPDDRAVFFPIGVKVSLYSFRQSVKLPRILHITEQPVISSQCAESFGRRQAGGKHPPDFIAGFVVVDKTERIITFPSGCGTVNPVFDKIAADQRTDMRRQNIRLNRVLRRIDRNIRFFDIFGIDFFCINHTTVGAAFRDPFGSVGKTVFPLKFVMPGIGFRISIRGVINMRIVDLEIGNNIVCQHVFYKIPTGNAGEAGGCHCNSRMDRMETKRGNFQCGCVIMCRSLAKRPGIRLIPILPCINLPGKKFGEFCGGTVHFTKIFAIPGSAFEPAGKIHEDKCDIKIFRFFKGKKFLHRAGDILARFRFHAAPAEGPAFPDAIDSGKPGQFCRFPRQFRRPEAVAAEIQLSYRFFRFCLNAGSDDGETGFFHAVQVQCVKSRRQPAVVQPFSVACDGTGDCTGGIGQKIFAGDGDKALGICI